MIDNFIVYDSARSNPVALAVYITVNKRLIIENVDEHNVYSDLSLVDIEQKEVVQYLKDRFETEYVCQYEVGKGDWV